jgi:hypothetical protein
MMINFVPGSTPATIGILTAGAFSTITQFIFC